MLLHIHSVLKYGTIIKIVSMIFIVCLKMSDMKTLSYHYDTKEALCITKEFFIQEKKKST